MMPLFTNESEQQKTKKKTHNECFLGICSHECLEIAYKITKVYLKNLKLIIMRNNGKQRYRQYILPKNP